MAITSVGTPTAATGTSGSQAGTWGTGQNQTAGDVLVAVVTFTSATTTTATACSTTGWANLLEVATSATKARTAIWWKPAAGGDPAPTFTSTVGTTPTSFVTLYELSGANGYVTVTTGTAVANAATVASQTATTSGNVADSGDFGIAGFCRERASTAAAVTASTYTLDASNTGVTSTGHSASMSLASPGTGATSSATVTYSLGSTTSDAAGAIVIFGLAGSGPPLPPLPQPPGVRVTWLRAGTPQASLIPVAPPVFTAAVVYPLPGPVRSRIAPPPRGRASGSTGAPVRNPTTGPAFRQAVQPARARIPQTFSKGRAAGNPGGPLRNPTSGPAVYPQQRPAQARQPLPPHGRATGNKGAPVQNPSPSVTGPPFYPFRQPARSRPVPPFLTGRAATMGVLPAPVQRPPSGPPAPPLQGPAGIRVTLIRVGSAQGLVILPPLPPLAPLYPLAGAAARRPPFSKGRAAGSRGAPVHNPPPPPAAAPPLRQPVRTRILPPPRGRATGSPGAPVMFPPGLQPVLPGPAGILVTVLRTGSALTGTHAGAPVHNPTAGPPFHLPASPVGARQPLPPHGRATGNKGAPVANPAPSPGPPFYPARQPVRARIPQNAPRGRASGSPGAPVRLTLTNTFEGGTSGNAVTTGNSGGASGNAFDAIQIPSGSTVAFDNSQVAHGHLAVKFASTTGAFSTYARWVQSLAAEPQQWFRMYLFVTANPGTNFPLLTFFSSGTSVTCGSVYLLTTGKLEWLDHNGSGIFTTTRTVPLNSWFRIEGYLTGSTTTGQVELKLFTPADSQVPVETDTSAATKNTGGVVDAVAYGIVAAIANIGPFWADDIGVSSLGYLGPSYLEGPASLGHPARAPLPARLPSRRLAGYTLSSPGTPVHNPASGPPVYPLPGPVRARLPELQPRAGRVASSPGALEVQAGPPFYPLNHPCRAAWPPPFSKGRASGNTGAPLSNPTPGPKVYPLQGPARSRLPQLHPRAGRVGSNPGAPVVHAGPPVYPLQCPVRARLPQLQPRAGRTGSSAGAPVRNPTAGPVFRQATQPTGARVPQTFSKGRVSGSPGAPVANPHPAQFYPLNKALRAQPAVFRKGRAASIAVPAPRFPAPSIQSPGQVTITPAAPLAALATITPAGPLTATAAITGDGPCGATVTISRA